jgi:hypothetical protein
VLDLAFAVHLDHFDVQSSKGLDESVQGPGVGFTARFERLGFFSQAVLQFGQVLLLFGGRGELFAGLLCGFALSLDLIELFLPDFLNLLFKLFLNLLPIQIPRQPLALLRLQHIHHFRQSPRFSQQFHNVRRYLFLIHFKKVTVNKNLIDPFKYLFAHFNLICPLVKLSTLCVQLLVL